MLPHGPLRDLERSLPGLRFGRSDAVLASLVPAIIEQKVTGPEAQRAYRRLVLRYGEPAPGPGGLHLPPAAPVLAGLPYYELHPLGLEQRRAVTLIRAAREAERLEAAVGLPPEEALALLQSVPGVGAWTAAETARSAFGDPDAVSVGDFHLPHLVCWAWPGSRAAMTGACWSCWSRTGASAHGWCASWSFPASCRRDTARGCGLAPSSDSDASRSQRQG